jgi:hypothetical protein
MLVQPYVEVCPIPAPKTGEGLDAEGMKKWPMVKPQIKVEVAFVEWTEARKLRHARFAGSEVTGLTKAP